MIHLPSKILFLSSCRRDILLLFHVWIPASDSKLVVVSCKYLFDIFEPQDQRWLLFLHNLWRVASHYQSEMKCCWLTNEKIIYVSILAFRNLFASYIILPPTVSKEICRSLQTTRVSYFHCTLSRPVECRLKYNLFEGV